MHVRYGMKFKENKKTHKAVTSMSQCNIYRGAKSYHNCNRTVRSSRYIVFDRKSIPIVA